MIRINDQREVPEPSATTIPAPDAVAQPEETAPAGVEGAVTAVLLIVSALVLWESIRIGVGELSRPGPGFMAAICAVGMIVTLTAILVSVIRRRPRSEASAAQVRHGHRLPVAQWFGHPSAQVVLIFVIMAGYTAMIPLIGYAVSTVLAASALLLLQGWRGWKVAIASLCIAAASAGVFVFLLGAPLPRLFGLA